MYTFFFYACEMSKHQVLCQLKKKHQSKNKKTRHFVRFFYICLHIKYMLTAVDNKKKYTIITYGCQMNFSDSEVVSSILNDNGYQSSDDHINSDLILLNTCSIREKAELTIRKKLQSFKKLKKKNSNLKIGVLGCMAERLKEKVLTEEKMVDLVVGPDAYRDIPNLLRDVEIGNNAVNVILSKDETYGDIDPSRLKSNGISAFVSITRGCDNMCTFCVVPFTRGRERSRDPKSIIKEILKLKNEGYSEITTSSIWER